MHRYCDDMVICCQYVTDTERVYKALGLRLNKYGSKLNEEKTRLLSFSKKRMKEGERQESFDFLGLTFCLGKSRSGVIIPKLKTNRKRFKSKLKRVKEWARDHRSKMRLLELRAIFCSKLRGHVAYYGIWFNQKIVRNFIQQSVRIVFKWLNRRGGKKKITWDKFQLFLERNPPPANIVHHKLFTLQSSQ